MPLPKRTSGEKKKSNHANTGSDEATGGGSGRQSGRRKGDNAFQKIDRAKVRKNFTRFPFATIDVSKDGRFVANLVSKPIGSAGICLLGPTAVVPDSKPNWGYEHVIAKDRVPFLPDDSLVVIHPGEQRLFLRYRPGSSAQNPLQVLLDLSQSELRDRLLLQDGMQIIFTDGRQEKTVNISLGPSARCDSFSAWHRRMSDDEFWAIRARLDEGSSFADDPTLVVSQGSDPKTQSVDQETLHSQVSVSVTLSDNDKSSSQNKTRRVKWGSGQVISISSDGERSMQEIELRDDGDEGVSSAYPGVKEEVLVKVTIDNQEFLKITGEDRFARSKSCIVRGGSDSSSMAGMSGEIVLPFATPNQAVAAFSFSTICSQLLLPRLFKKSASAVRVLLAVPTNVMLPLVAGDVIVMRSKTHGESTIRLTIPKLSRSAPSERSVGSEEGGALNSEHFLASIAVEGTHQLRKMRWNGSVDASTNSEAVVVSFAEEFFNSSPSSETSDFAKANNGEFANLGRMVRIGRSQEKCNLSLPDPHLSRLHAVISRQSVNHFALTPVETKEGKKSVYLLCGKTDSHYRPPIALRTGDSVFVGRSELKVVFQQRGDRKVHAGATIREELEGRLNTLRRRLNLAVKGDAKHPPVDESPSKKTTLEENQEDAVEDELVTSFKTLNPAASEKSSGSVKRNLSAQVADAPTFRDLNALLDYFDINSSNMSGPMMILMSVRGPKARQFFFINPVETTIGSSLDADICIPNDRRMSPFHCRIYFDLNQERWLLDDLQSKHGTFLKVDEPTLLCSGDVFVMGLSLFRVFGRQHDASVAKNKCNQS